MSETQITPHRITKPIQLLASWLAGLAIIDGAFLTAAANIPTPAWIPGALVVASIVNVPLFLISLFLLQTKFRPEMQEDSYYSEYLQKRVPSAPEPKTARRVERSREELAQKIVAEVSDKPDKDQPRNQKKIEKLLKESEIEYLANRYSSSRSLSELHMYPNLWNELVKEWGEDRKFKKELDEMVEAGLLEHPSNDLNDAKLTNIGKDVAEKLEHEEKLWNQKYERHMPNGHL